MLKKHGFYKGLNLGGWLSQCDYSQKHLNSFITEKDFETIASWGADHVRIPIDYNILQNNDGSFNEIGFERLDYALDMCEKYNLNTVIDLHKTAGYSFDEGESENGFFYDEKLQEKFYLLWDRISEKYGSLYKRTAFELLNEVTDKKYSDIWNDIARKCITRIRKNAPQTLILYGGCENNSAEAVSLLTSPWDENVIYNFHCYEPLTFTHQGATWTERINPENRISYSECGCNTDFFEKEFAPALEAAKNNNTIIYCGEYGVIDRVPIDDILSWYRDIHTVFEKYGIGRCTWNYKEKDFGISDKRLDSIRNELLKYL
ncbi:MAG: glycoside hydrolase family 5 protein [Ruminococcus sp.]|nr:glycoside hydrolase family 5 protein [Ruminococcus sp.]